MLKLQKQVSDIGLASSKGISSKDPNSHSGYHTIKCSIFTIYIKTKIRHKVIKTAGAVILQLVLQLQKRNNFSVIPI